MFLLELLSRLPLRILYRFSDLMFAVSYYVIRYRRNIARNNLRKSFPYKTESELIDIEKKFYRNLCDYAVETLKLLSMEKDEVMRRMVFKNPEVAAAFARDGKPMIFLASHQFNWEWLLAGACLNTSPQLYYVYQRQSSSFFDLFSNLIRKRFGGLPVRREQVGREALRKRGTLHSLALLADQFPGLGHDKRYWTNFLHQETAFFQGVNQLAIITQYPVIFFVCRKISRGHYECEMITISVPPYAKDELNVIANYVSKTEEIIHDQPENWLWTHNRWKKTREEMGDARMDGIN